MSKETEIVIYAKVTNPQGFENAKAVIHQEQAQIRAPNGRIRVRAERKDSNSTWTYILTTKKAMSKEDGLQSCDEVNVKINQEQYEMFKSVCDQFMRKTRYVFEVEDASFKAGKLTGSMEDSGLTYEVDRFIQEDGSYSEWVKIDVEIDNLKEKLSEVGLNPETVTHLNLKISALPIGLASAFIDDGKTSGKMRDLVSLIYDKQFIRKLI